MHDFPHKQLLVNYLLGICTMKERLDVDRWLEEDQENVLLLQQVAEEFGNRIQFPLPDKAVVKKELMQHITKTVPPVEDTRRFMQSRNIRRPLFYNRREFWLKLAAMFLVMTMAGGAGIFFGLNFEQEDTADVQPEAIIQQSTMSYGQTASLRFGDGSVIRMNGGSTLRYPETFVHDKREVWLEGEAFFTIAHDESRPFIVHAANTTTRVLGTSFNIKAYKGEGELQIAVVDGRVEVSRTGTGDSENEIDESFLLEKNQWLTYRGQTGSVDQVLERGDGDIWDMVAWKDRVLVFRNKSFERVAGMLERWYGVNITIEDPSLKSYILEGEHHNASLEEVLKSIQFVMDFEYVITGNEVLIQNS